MRRCDFCGRRHREESLRSFRPDYDNGDPRPASPFGLVFFCEPCWHRRERFIRTLERNRAKYAHLKAVL